MKAGLADMPFSLYPLALAEWKLHLFSVVVCRSPAEPAAPAWGPEEAHLTGHTELVVFM